MEYKLFQIFSSFMVLIKMHEIHLSLLAGWMNESLKEPTFLPPILTSFLNPTDLKFLTIRIGIPTRHFPNRIMIITTMMGSSPASRQGSTTHWPALLQVQPITQHTPQGDKAVWAVSLVAVHGGWRGGGDGGGVGDGGGSVPCEWRGVADFWKFFS